MKCLMMAVLAALIAFGAKCEDKKPDAPATPAAKPATTGPTTEGLVLNWKLDAAKTDVATDTTDKKNNGTLDNKPAFVDGKVGKALSFEEGKSSSASVATVNGITEGNTAHTIAAWIKVAKLPENRSWILVLGNDGEGAHHWLINAAGETQFGAWGGNQVKPALKVGEWAHVAITFDGTKLIGYLNGTQSESTDATFNLAGAPLTVAKVHNDENYFEGQIEDVRVYSRALTDKEVAALAKVEAK